LSLAFAPLPALRKHPAILALGLSEFSKGISVRQRPFSARAEEAAPARPIALLYESKAYIHLEQFTAAEVPCGGTFRRMPLPVKRCICLAMYCTGEGKAAESLETYTKAAHTSDTDRDDLKIVWTGLFLLNDYPDAIKWLEKAVEAEPKNKEAWYFLGRAYYTKSSIPEARKAFLTVLQLDPRDAKAENNLGLILNRSPTLMRRWMRTARQFNGKAKRASERATVPKLEVC